MYCYSCDPSLIKILLRHSIRWLSNKADLGHSCVSTTNKLLYGQVSTQTGRNQLPIFRCTSVHLIYACCLRWRHESKWAHNLNQSVHGSSQSITDLVFDSRPSVQDLVKRGWQPATRRRHWTNKSRLWTYCKTSSKNSTWGKIIWYKIYICYKLI